MKQNVCGSDSKNNASYVDETRVGHHMNTITSLSLVKWRCWINERMMNIPGARWNDKYLRTWQFFQ